MEMGFPPPDEAMGIYRRTPTSKLLDAGLSKEKIPVIDKEQALLPALYMDHLSEARSLIADAISSSREETRDRYIFEMIYLANKIIMADYCPLNEVEGLKRSIENASAITSLGLAAAVRGQKKQAREVLENSNAETLFAIGYNLILDQKARLREILNRVDLTMIPGHLSRYVDGLMKKRPLFGNIEFSDMEQLKEVTLDIDRIGAMATLMEQLGWSRDQERLSGTNTDVDTDMEAVVITAIAVNAVKGELFFRPLHLAELREFIGKASKMASGGRRLLAPEFRKSLTSFLQSLETSLDKVLLADIESLILNRIEEELAGLKKVEDLDPRFISCFVVNLTTG
jgi:hypothetical protein